MKLSAADEAKLKKVHPDLVKVIRKAATMTTVPFKIMETARSVEQQRINIKKGVSWTMNSRHIVSKDGLCRAADIVPLVDGKVSWSWPVYHKLAPIMKAAAKAVGVPVAWGGDWQKTKDGPHWELDRKTYP
jgi:peptidoglycan L-alanyl-D-glutamate endopeptidase CwlK